MTKHEQIWAYPILDLVNELEGKHISFPLQYRLENDIREAPSFTDISEHSLIYLLDILRSHLYKEDLSCIFD